MSAQQQAALEYVLDLARDSSMGEPEKIRHAAATLRAMVAPPLHAPAGLVELVAQAIHDGAPAQAQYVAAGIRPHSYRSCEWADQYRADAQVVLEALTPYLR